MVIEVPWTVRCLIDLERERERTEEEEEQSEREECAADGFREVPELRDVL